MDIVVVAALAAFVIFGACRGLFRALAGLVAVVAALVGAGMIAGALSGPAANLITPMIAQRIEAQVSDAMAVQSAGQMPEGGDGGFEIEDLLALMGIDGDVRDSLAQQAQERVRDAGATIAMAVVESVAQTIIYGGLYILSFLGLTILLKLLIRAMDLVLQLPGLHLLNTAGGAAVGLIEGALLLFLAIWAMRRLGVSFETETVTATHILRFFTTNTPLSALSFLK